MQKSVQSSSNTLLKKELKANTKDILQKPSKTPIKTKKRDLATTLKQLFSTNIRSKSSKDFLNYQDIIKFFNNHQKFRQLLVYLKYIL